MNNENENDGGRQYDMTASIEDMENEIDDIVNDRNDVT